jgi:DNA-binding CsgD family transcriptional regulator
MKLVPSRRDAKKNAPMSHRSRQALTHILDELYDRLPSPGPKRFRWSSIEWRLVDTISTGSGEYLVLRRELLSSAPLTQRERQAVQLAMGGATNKEIAWALEVSASTVGVFLWRAARKLQAAGRDSLFRAFMSAYPDHHALTLDEWQPEMTRR